MSATDHRDSCDRLGATRAEQINRSIAGDPLRLDDGIPVLTDRAPGLPAGRYKRHLHLVQPGEAAQAAASEIDAAQRREKAAQLAQLQAQAAWKSRAAESMAITRARQKRAQRAELWRVLATAYGIAALALLMVVVVARHQGELLEGLRIAYRAVGLFLLGA